MLQNILKSGGVDGDGTRYAVIVNDMGELNIDERLIGEYVVQKEEKIVELSNGCICCSLREDLIKEVGELARKGCFDHLIVESTGISEPLPVAETFMADAETLAQSNHDHQQHPAHDQALHGGMTAVLSPLRDVAELDTMVTVVDAVNFLADMDAAEDLHHRATPAGEEDFRTLTELLVAQVEFADVIVINKCDEILRRDQGDGVGDGIHRLTRLRQTLRALNSEAKFVETNYSELDVKAVVGARLFDYEAAQRRPSWLKAMNDPDRFNHHQHQHSSEGEKDTTRANEIDMYGINSFVYQARRPFHPERLLNFIETQLGTEDEAEDFTVVRSKGFFWLASRPQEQMVWSQAGGLFQLSPGGVWWADTPSEEWPPEGSPDLAQVVSDSVEGCGDRRQELVFIGLGFSQGGEKTGEVVLRRALDACLLTDAEFGRDGGGGIDTRFGEWMAHFVDPLPRLVDGDDAQE